MRAVVAATAGALALSACGPANALTGTELYRNCTEGKQSIGSAMCLAYVRGFAEGIVFGNELGKLPRAFCPPTAGLHVDQARLIIEKFLRDNPDKLHNEAVFLAGQALMEAFGCIGKSN